MAREVGLDAVVRPSVDDRATERATSRMGAAFDRAAEITPSIDMSSVRSAVENAIPGMGLLSGLTGRGGGSGGGGGRSDGLGEVVSPLESIDDTLDDIERSLRKRGFESALSGGGGDGDAGGMVGNLLGSAGAGGAGGLLGRLGLSGTGGAVAGVASRAAPVAARASPYAAAGLGALELGRQAREGVEFGERDGETTARPTGRGLTRDMGLGVSNETEQGRAMNQMSEQGVEIRGLEDTINDFRELQDLPPMSEFFNPEDVPSLSSALKVDEVPTLDETLGGVDEFVSDVQSDLTGLTDIDISGDIDNLGEQIVDGLGDPQNIFEIDAPVDLSVSDLDRVEDRLDEELRGVRDAIDDLRERLTGNPFS